MKSIDKLREMCAKWRKTSITPGRNSAADEVDAIADEIVAEIADNYMRLPVDADGVPIHCGERMRLDNGHEGDVWLIGVFDIMMSDHTCFDWAKSRHVKPRTLEDVLTEMLDRNTDGVGLREFNRDFGAFVAHYADEIRELLSKAGD